MNNLENIVPPPELCKCIPAGKFEDGALVYTLAGELKPRRIIIDGFEHRYDGTPAPTLAEILEAITNNGVLVRDETNGTWTVIQWDGLHDKRENDANPATAALRLWLEVEGVK